MDFISILPRPEYKAVQNKLSNIGSSYVNSAKNVVKAVSNAFNFNGMAQDFINSGGFAGEFRANGNYQRWKEMQTQNAVDAANDVSSDFTFAGLPKSSFSTNSSATAPVSSGAITAPSSAVDLERVWDNADLAKVYNMDNSTAYQEALSNTSYQRAVKDMQAAGLNPAALFGAGRVSGADGVSYVPGTYTYSGDSSGAYSSSKSYSSAKSSYAINNGTYNLVKLAGGALGLLATKGKYYGFMAGQSAATGILRMINGYSK